MHPISHFLTGWVVANAAEIERRDRAIVTVAGILPDVDGIGYVAQWLTRNSARPHFWYDDYHHVVAHNLPFAILATAVAFTVAKRRVRTALLAFLAFHLHLVCDVLSGAGMGGPLWPIYYFWPFDKTWMIQWAGQWKMNAWPNVAFTAVLLLLTLYWAWKRGYSPLELVSQRADRSVVRVLRNRFGEPAGEDA